MNEIKNRFLIAEMKKIEYFAERQYSENNNNISSNLNILILLSKCKVIDDYNSLIKQLDDKYSQYMIDLDAQQCHIIYLIQQNTFKQIKNIDNSQQRLLSKQIKKEWNENNDIKQEQQAFNLCPQ